MNADEETLEDLLQVKFRWPQRGDRLFEAAAHWSENAEIHDNPGARLSFMTSGYKMAGDRLVDVAQSSRWDRHYLIYPILFCYRQFLELALKAQISDYGAFASVELPKGGNQHDLKILLKRFRRICIYFSPGETQPLIPVSKCILEFDRMDRSSFAFRYATTKKGDLYPVTRDRLDLHRLKDVMDGIEGFFEGADGYHSELVSNYDF